MGRLYRDGRKRHTSIKRPELKHFKRGAEYAREYKKLMDKEYGYDGVSAYMVDRDAQERMVAPEPTVTVDEESFQLVIETLEKQLEEFPENNELILNLKKQLKLWKY